MSSVALEVVVETGTYEGGWKYAGSADADPASLEASAVLAARTLWDEAYTGTQGCRRRVTFRTFAPSLPEDGKVVYRAERRP